MGWTVLLRQSSPIYAPRSLAAGDAEHVSCSSVEQMALGSASIRISDVGYTPSLQVNTCTKQMDGIPQQRPQIPIR